MVNADTYSVHIITTATCTHIQLFETLVVPAANKYSKRRSGRHAILTMFWQQSQYDSRLRFSYRVRVMVRVMVMVMVRVRVSDRVMVRVRASG